AILALRLSDDEPSTAVKNRTKQPTGTTRAASNAPSRLFAGLLNFPLRDRINGIWEIRRSVGLNERYYYYGSSPSSWMPGDFGQARLAALGWLLSLAQKRSTQDAFLKERREQRDKAAADLRTRWDWYYLQLAKGDNREVY